MRRIKVIATVGPACRDRSTLHKLIDAGVDVFRLNFSHASHEDYARDIAAIREIADASGRTIGVLADLQGPKIRVGKFKDGRIFLHRGQKFTLSSGVMTGDENGVSVSYANLPQSITPGATIYLSDGMLSLKVDSVDGVDVKCTVTQGGELSDHKGVNVPGLPIDLPALTEKDIVDLNFAIDQGVDWLALSFVRSPNDLYDIKERIGDEPVKVIAKIEKTEALDSLAEIIAAADGIMIARGDLGIETPLEEVPLIQRRITRAARISAKPVIIATQMLDSMTRQPRPTRAEATDVAHAVYDGADALMLSNETAIGSFPVEAVEMAVRIATAVERDSSEDRPASNVLEFDIAETTHAISRGACQVADELRAKAIITSTRSGETSRQVAKHRPRTPLIAVSSDMTVVRQLTLTWGVLPIRADAGADVDEMIDLAVGAAKDAGVVESGDSIVITAGVLIDVAGTTNMIKVHEVE